MSHANEHRARTPRASGFSAIELMIVLVIASILLAIAIPSFRSMLQNYRITTAANDLFAAVILTRSEAIGRGMRVDLVPAGDGADWSKGWVVFIDDDGDQTPGPGERIIYSHGPVAAGISIKSAFTDSKRNYIAYTGSGRSRTNANAQSPQVGSWSLLIDSTSRRIKVNFLGRPRVCNPEIEKSTC